MTTMPRHILVVDDDPHIRDVICFALDKAGMETEPVGDGMAALARIERRMPDLVVLDVGMPEMDGLELCRRLRRTSDVPVLFLSARDEEIDRILGLEMGGDDYVTKPFSPRELVARVNVILRRARPAPAELVSASLSHGLIVLDPLRRAVNYDDRDIDLTATEFTIVKALMTKPMHVLNRSQLIDASHAANIHVSERTVDSHIRNIRAKFATVGCSNAIETVHGMGFRLGRCGA
ncbi:two-component system OmpR family response regulator [Aminobacter ciceronei]|uniref:Two-component system OmpR family response regulator n=2 Tax=Phyllobacteriaceae TaxID=69277 RepID=A0ABR6CEE9_9HYPH|nr:two-component system OmpR family response regulator [Aminobacter ciceronei]MBA9023414.1 two-component system OmpR family response regulator [Aminobacter ciceronei]